MPNLLAYVFVTETAWTSNITSYYWNLHSTVTNRDERLKLEPNV